MAALRQGLDLAEIGPGRDHDAQHLGATASEILRESPKLPADPIELPVDLASEMKLRQEDVDRPAEGFGDASQRVQRWRMDPQLVLREPIRGQTTEGGKVPLTEVKGASDFSNPGSDAAAEEVRRSGFEVFERWHGTGSWCTCSSFVNLCGIPCSMSALKAKFLEHASRPGRRTRGKRLASHASSGI
jgi:hypothetical protein